MRTHGWTAIPLAALALGGCSVAWQDRMSYSYGAGTPCAKTMEWCVFEVPQLGYLGIKAQGDIGTEHTSITLRLAPLQGKEARWSARELVVIDLDSKAAKQVSKLDTQPVTGGHPSFPLQPKDFVFYGGYSSAEFLLRPRIERFELRFPAVISGDDRLQVPPIQIVDGMRYPVPVPWFLGSH